MIAKKPMQYTEVLSPYLEHAIRTSLDTPDLDDAIRQLEEARIFGQVFVSDDPEELIEHYAYRVALGLKAERTRAYRRLFAPDPLQGILQRLQRTTSPERTLAP